MGMEKGLIFYQPRAGLVRYCREQLPRRTLTPSYGALTFPFAGFEVIKSVRRDLRSRIEQVP